MYIAIIKDSIHHEGDQRSRDYPGHGYPAWTEDVEKIERFKSEDELKEWILSRGKYDRYEIYHCTPVKIETKISVEIK